MGGSCHGVFKEKVDKVNLTNVMKYILDCFYKDEIHKTEVNGTLRIIEILKHKDIKLDYLAQQIEEWMDQQSQEIIEQQDVTKGEPEKMLSNHEDEDEQIINLRQEDEVMEMTSMLNKSSEQTEHQSEEKQGLMAEKDNEQQQRINPRQETNSADNQTNSIVVDLTSDPDKTSCHCSSFSGWLFSIIKVKRVVLIIGIVIGIVIVFGLGIGLGIWIDLQHLHHTRQQGMEKTSGGMTEQCSLDLYCSSPSQLTDHTIENFGSIQVGNKLWFCGGKKQERGCMILNTLDGKLRKLDQMLNIPRNKPLMDIEGSKVMVKGGTTSAIESKTGCRDTQEV